MIAQCCELKVMSEGLVSIVETNFSPTPSLFFSRKLKNRVAAQTARDRKKAKMGELEQQVLELELEVYTVTHYSHSINL